MKFTGLESFKHNQTEKIGVLLINLGTPEQPTAKALRRYLKEFLSDHRVVEIPKFIWWMILHLIILPFRAKRSAKAYQSVWRDDGSPLLVNMQKLSDKVAQAISPSSSTNSAFIVDFAMRYGTPDLDSKIEKLQQSGASKLLVLPLYPQYSATTTASTFDAVAQSFAKRRLLPELRFVNHYHDTPEYIDALANKIESHWQTHGKADKLLLSFHGIPKRNWLLGDPYACECHKTSRLLAERLAVASDFVVTTFQSRFGKAEWIKPYTDATLQQMAKDGVKSVQVVCPGFSVDCLETLEEIADENREYFEQAGGQDFQYIPCLNDDQAHVDLLLAVIDQHSQGWILDNDDLTQRQQRKQLLEQSLASQSD